MRAIDLDDHAALDAKYLLIYETVWHELCSSLSWPQLELLH